MSDESNSFTTARARLEDIVAQVRKKDTSLEKSLDLLEEGVRLANACTELIDSAEWTAADVASGAAVEASDEPAEGLEAAGQSGEETVIVVEDVLVEQVGDTAVVEVVETVRSISEDGFEDADLAWADEEPALPDGDDADLSADADR